jgi:hypothetical protein
VGILRNLRNRQKKTARRIGNDGDEYRRAAFGPESNRQNLDSTGEINGCGNPEKSSAQTKSCPALDRGFLRRAALLSGLRFNYCRDELPSAGQKTARQGYGDKRKVVEGQSLSELSGPWIVSLRDELPAPNE